MEDWNRVARLAGQSTGDQVVIVESIIWQEGLSDIYDKLNSKKSTENLFSTAVRILRFSVDDALCYFPTLNCSHKSHFRAFWCLDVKYPDMCI